MTKMGKSLSTTVSHYNNSYRELSKIDRDVVKVVGEGNAQIDPVALDKPRQDDE